MKDLIKVLGTAVACTGDCELCQKWNKDFCKQKYKAIEIIEATLKNYEKLNKDYSKVVNEKTELCVMCAKEHTALDIIRRIPFELEYDEDTDDWHLYIVITTQDGEYRETVAFGEGKDKYDLLKEELLWVKN